MSDNPILKEKYSKGKKLNRVGYFAEGGVTEPGAAEPPVGFDDYLAQENPQAAVAAQGIQQLAQPVAKTVETAAHNVATGEGLRSYDQTLTAAMSGDPAAQQQIAEHSLGTAMGTINPIKRVGEATIEHSSTSSKEFYKTLNQARADSSRVAEATHIYKPSEYEKMNTYLSPDKKSGFAVKPDGDLVSVFSLEKGRGNTIVQQAKEAGATKLDAFDNGYLKEFYQKHGFKEYKREPNWTGKGPDVVYMKLPELTHYSRSEGPL